MDILSNLTLLNELELLKAVVTECVISPYI